MTTRISAKQWRESNQLPTKAPIERAKYRSKLEARFAAEIMCFCQIWGYEEITFKIGLDTRYTPDFYAFSSIGQLKFYEVKGYRRPASMVKLRVAASKFPWARFVLVEWKNGWCYTEIQPA